MEFPEGKKKSKLLHVNLLRKYHRANPNEILFIQTDIYADTSLEEIKDYKGIGNDGDFEEAVQTSINGILSHGQRKDLAKILRRYRTTLSDRPGKTDLVMHEIDTGSNPPVRKKPYRVPAAKRHLVETEVAKMLQEGIIRPSESDYASPIVLVPKADGTVRFCADYRELN